MDNLVFSQQVADAVPEPGTLVLMLIGSIGFAAVRKLSAKS